jgi:uncharacterized protein (DUF2384 family)
MELPMIALAQTLPANAAQAAVGTALNIMDKWNCSEKEKMALLGVGRSTLHKYQAAPASARLSPDLLERISYLLNIHAVLRILFENPENQYGFLRMPNQNTFFNGKAPIEILSSGLMSALYEVHRHLDAIRDGQFA